MGDGMEIAAPPPCRYRSQCEKMNTKPRAEGFVQSRNDQHAHIPHYGRHRLLPDEAALRRRATRWCARTRWQVVALNYEGILRLFRDQQHARHRERWTAHL